MRCALWTPLLDSFVLSLTFPVALLGTYRVEGGTSSCHEVMELTARVSASRLPLILLLKLSFYSDWSSWPSLQRRAQGGSIPQAWVLAVLNRSLFGGKGRVPGTPQCCRKEYPAGWKLCEENPSCDQKAVTSVFGFEITGGITHAKKKNNPNTFFFGPVRVLLSIKQQQQPPLHFPKLLNEQSPLFPLFLLCEEQVMQRCFRVSALRRSLI